MFAAVVFDLVFEY